MSRPVVLIAGKDPLGTTGGHPSYVRAHAFAAARAGFDPHVFCLARQGDTVSTDFGTLHRVGTPLRPVRRLMASAHSPFLSRGIERFLSGKEGPHVIHGFGAWAFAAVAAARRLARKGTVAVAVASAYSTLEHECRAKLAGLRGHHGLSKWMRYHAEYLWIRLVADGFEKSGYAGSRLILVNYESVKRILEEAYGLAGRVRRISYATAAAFRGAGEPGPPPAPLSGLRSADAPLVLSVSRHDPRKGLDVLLQALASLHRAGVPFRACLAGPGPLLNAHRKLAHELGLDGSILVPGRVEDVFSYLYHADVFVLPSLEEGSGSVSLLEALQAGLAVVASSCDGIPEDVTDGEDALLVAPGDPAALEAALSRLLGDEALRRQLARRARETFEKRFSPDVFSRDLGAVYREMGEP